MSPHTFHRERLARDAGTGTPAKEPSYEREPQECGSLFLCIRRTMDDKTIQTIEAILKRGNDAKVRRKGGGYVVIEIKETIKYSPPAIVAGEGQ